MCLIFFKILEIFCKALFKMAELYIRAPGNDPNNQKVTSIHSNLHPFWGVFVSYNYSLQSYLFQLASGLLSPFWDEVDNKI